MAQKLEGIVFPVTNDKGERNTTPTNKNIFAASVGAIDPEAAKQIQNEANWRFGYQKHVVQNVRKSLLSPDSALQAAKAGLDYMHEHFEFIRGDKTYKLADAMKEIKGSFHTGFLKGEGAKPANLQFEVPYPTKDTKLSGDALLRQLKKWADYGTIEPSTREAIEQVVKNPGWVDLSDRWFVLFGAGSAMGPYSVLLSLGANVIALDLDRAPIWQRLIDIAKKSWGTVTFPLKKPQKEITSDEELYQNAGANLITQTPEILNWLLEVQKDKHLTVGSYVYLDGDAHVRVVMACEAIIKGLLDNKRDISLAFLCTPTDCHVISADVRKAAEANYNAMSLVNLALTPIRLFGGKKYLVKNVEPKVTAKDGSEFYINDSLTVPQGPNYALAKRAQHWRAILARHAGHTVSSHVAPTTSTASVLHNKQIAWALGGMSTFVPMEIFQQETSNAVMSAILIHDLRNPKSPAHPDFPLRNPLELFSYSSFHGGMWRNGYKFNTVPEVAALSYFLKLYRPYILISILVLIFAIFFRR